MIMPKWPKVEVYKKFPKNKQSNNKMKTKSRK